jgi:hypothetical protein
MSNKEAKVTQISWTDEIIKFIVFNVIAVRILNFLIKKIKLKLRLEGESHLRQRIFVIFGVDIMMFLLDGVAYVPRKEEEPEYINFLTRFLKLHRRYHQLAGNNVCCVCLNIDLFQTHFQRYVTDKTLYPDAKKRVEKSTKLLTSFF